MPRDADDLSINKRMTLAVTPPNDVDVYETAS